MLDFLVNFWGVNFPSAFSPYFLPQVGGTREVIRIHPQKRPCVSPITAWNSSCPVFWQRTEHWAVHGWRPLWSHKDWTSTIIRIFPVKMSPIAFACFGFYCHRQKEEHGDILRLEPRSACCVQLSAQGILFNEEGNEWISLFQLLPPCPRLIGRHLGSAHNPLASLLPFMLVKILHCSNICIIQYVVPIWIHIKKEVPL